MDWKDKLKNGLKKTGSAIKKGAIILAKEIEANETARRERVSVLNLLDKEQLKEISKKFDIDVHDSLEFYGFDEKPSEPTRNNYIIAIANNLSLEVIRTALTSINADERVFNKLKEIEEIRKMRERIVRKKFLEAKDELQRARDAINKSDWPEVLNHIRGAIDLSLKEKFGFKKIHPMSKFIEDARTLGLQLPSYEGIYGYFDFGSKRLHEGLIHTPLEAESAVKFVENFVDELNQIPVDENKVIEFKNKCRAVE